MISIRWTNWRERLETFGLPAFVLALIMVGLFSAPGAYGLAVVIGIARVLFEAYQEMREGRYALDYIAFLAMAVALITGQTLAGAIVTLMFTGGKGLEIFAGRRAEASLRRLGDTIPKNVFAYRDGAFVEVPLQAVGNGERILVKRHELVPLDGTLVSKRALLEMANLTGEAGAAEFSENVLIKSGAVNVGDTLELRVVGDFTSSTYHHIVQLVEEAKEHPSRFVRLSARVSGYFTLFTLAFAGFGYLLGGVTGLLAVLVVATPCPLIIAAPVAFIGGMSRLARRQVIVRRPSALEQLDKADVIFFDKTGTLTFGEPELDSIDRVVPAGERYSAEELLGIAASIEIHSLHPLARAIVREARRREIPFAAAVLVSEQLGKGITGKIEAQAYTMTGVDRNRHGITLALLKDGQVLAEFHFIDRLKAGAAEFLQYLQEQGIETSVITGDTMENAREVFGDIPVPIRANALPEDKHQAIAAEHARGKLVGMVGDGLNDAPALARADVGIVFSNTDNAASINAADIVMLDQDITRLRELIEVSHRTLVIARQSVYAGVGLSLIAMAFAAAGFITPVAGALLQEAIDIVVILNALRALR